MNWKEMLIVVTGVAGIVGVYTLYLFDFAPLPLARGFALFFTLLIVIGLTFALARRKKPTPEITPETKTS